MLTVTNGYKLYTAAPSSHDYRFQAMPSPVVRSVTAPFDPSDSPPTLINDMGESILLSYPTAEDCTLTSFSFRLLSNPQTVHSLSSARNPNFGNAYMPTVDGNFVGRAATSRIPYRYAPYTGSPDGHVKADGTVFYTAGAIYVTFVVDYGGGEEFKPDLVGLLHGFNDILLVPQSISQREYLYTVSGS